MGSTRIWARWLAATGASFEAGRCPPRSSLPAWSRTGQLELTPADSWTSSTPGPAPYRAPRFVAKVRARYPSASSPTQRGPVARPTTRRSRSRMAFAYRFLSFELGLVKPDREIFDGPAGPADGPLPTTTCADGSPSRHIGPHVRWCRRGAPAGQRAVRRLRMCQHAAMVANGPSLRLLPRLSDDVAFFWTSGADGVLRLLRCNACGFFIHPPGRSARAACRVTWRRRRSAAAASRDVHGQPPAVDPRERPLHHRLGVHRRAARRPADDQPGRRRARGRAVGMPVRVVFEHVEDVWLPLFRPRGHVVSPGPARSRWSGGRSSRASASPAWGAGSGAPTSTSPSRRRWRRSPTPG